MDNNVFLQRAGRIAGVGGWRVDLATNTVEWSQKTCEILEYPENHVPTLEEAISLYTDESRPIINRLVTEAMSHGTPYDVELTIRCRSGTVKWVRSIGEVEYADGVAVAIAGAFQDVTERRLRDEQIAKSNAETKAYYDNAPCGYYSLGPDRTIVRANDRLLSWLGATRAEVIGLRKPTDFMTPESLPRAIEAFKRLRSEGEASGLECELLPVNGVSRHVSISAKAYYDEKGQFLHTSSVMYDITELVSQRKRADQLSHDLFAMIDNELVATIITKDRTFTWANKAMHRMFGYDEGELVGLPTSVGYKDEASYLKVGAEAYPMLRKGIPYRCELDMVRKNGSTIWVQMQGMTLQNRDGETMWMMADVTELKLANLKAAHQASHDALTGLPNRRGFESISRTLIEAAGQHGRKVAFCILDLDGFKAANDRFGHDAGDVVLQTVTDRLGKSVRSGDYVFRLGGDEFAIILDDPETGSSASAILHDVAAALRVPIEVSGTALVRISGSMGFSLYPDDGTESSDLLRMADLAMYQAKKTGKDKVLRTGKAGAGNLSARG